MIARRLDDDEKAKINPKLNLGLLSRSNNNEPIIIVNESGLYSVIFFSRKPEAKQFKRKVTHEVLPSIRKHGMYATDELLNNPDLLIEALQRLKLERAEKEKAQKELEIAKPKVSYYDTILNSKSLLPISVIAKDYGKSAQWLNNFLHKQGIQYRQGKTWLPYQKYSEKGYTQSKTHSHQDSDGETRSSTHTYWTQKGRVFIYELLKEHGHLPVVEQESTV
jgi:phage antirepressor YoqD-like protein